MIDDMLASPAKVERTTIGGANVCVGTPNAMRHPDRARLTIHGGGWTLRGGRFVMGIGVSHHSSVVARGHEYLGPVATMTYLDGYAAAPWSGPTVDDMLAQLRVGRNLPVYALVQRNGAVWVMVGAFETRSERQPDSAISPAEWLSSSPQSTRGL